MIRSYQKVGRDFSDTRLYTFGKRADGQPLHLPTPIPVMGLVWAAGTFVVALILGRILGIAPLPHHHASGAAYGPAMLWYIGIPVAVGWLMTMAEVEGRRIHVIIRARLSQGLSKHYVGGYLPTDSGSEKIRYRNIKARQYEA